MSFALPKRWLVGVAVVACVVAAGCRKQASVPAPDEGKAPEVSSGKPDAGPPGKEKNADGGRSKEVAAVFNAVELAQALRKDKNALDRYEGKVLRIEGIVRTVDLKPDGNDPGDASVELRAPADDPEENRNFKMCFTLRDKPGAAKIGPWQKVTLEGRLISVAVHVVVVTDARVVAAGPVAFTQVELDRLRMEKPKISAALKKLGVNHEREDVRLTDMHLTAEGLIKPEVLDLLTRLSDIYELVLSDTRISDAGLAGLKKLVDVYSVNLRQTKIGDRGLAHLKEVRGLRALEVGNYQRSDPSPITDDGLAHLKGIEDLHILTVRTSRVTDAGLAHLAGLLNLQILELENNRITDAGLVHVRRLRKLERLRLPNAQISGQGLVHLKGIAHIRELDLSECPVNDAGLEALATLGNVDSLYLSKKAKFTPAGLKKVKAARPKLDIIIRDD
jgi:hypothetical protein